MNGRTARKLLMRGRKNHGLWGRRAYLTVRLGIAAKSEWCLYDYGNHPALDAFLFAARSAKAEYFDVIGDEIYITYAVKWFFADTKLRFASRLAKAIRVAKGAGVSARVIEAWK